MTQDDLEQITAGFEPDTIRHVINCGLKGQLSPAIVVVQLLIQMRQIEPVDRMLGKLFRRTSVHLFAALEQFQQVAKMQRLLWENRDNCICIVEMLRDDLSIDLSAHSINEGISHFTRLFDRAVRQSEEASVAWYSLGNSQLLDEATEEVVDLLNRWDVLGPDQVILDIGCGIGRFEVVLTRQVREIYGIDISPNMIEVERHRCTGFNNVYLSTCSGQDLASFDEGMFDMVMAIDSFPYIHQLGPTLVKRHLDEVARVLRKGGNFVILNFSYRGDLEADCADVSQLAAAYGFEVLVNGLRPFSLWDGVAWRLRSL